MDLQLLHRLTILAAIWSSLFLSIMFTNAISKSTTLYITWGVYSCLVGITFYSLKRWNRSLQEPLLDLNLTKMETFISVALAVLVSLFGGTLMQLETMKSTFWLLLLAFVMTASQFTLLKVSSS